MLSLAMVFTFTRAHAVTSFSYLASHIALLHHAVVHLNEYESIADSRRFGNVR